MTGVYVMGLILVVFGLLAVILGGLTTGIFGGILIGSGTIFMAIAPRLGGK